MSTILIVIISAAAVGITLYLLKKSVNLGFIMLLDAVFVAVLTQISLKDTLKYAFAGLVSDKTIKLSILIFLIMILENIMRTTGMMKTVVASLKELVGSNRVTAALLSLVIGMLPSPAGARFSCPMVEEIIGDNADAYKKSFINYWFRHVWMDGFILYPGIILASELMEVHIIEFFIHLLPFIILSALLGTVFGILPVKKEVIERTRPWKDSLKLLITSMLPVIAVIAIYISLINITPYSLEISLGSVVIGMLFIKKYGKDRIKDTIKQAFPLKLIFIIVGVMIFKEVLFGSGAIDGLPDFMKGIGIPVAALFVLLPFFAGFSSGIAVSFVSIAFPILLPLGLGDNMWYAVLAYAAGFIGVMVTPLHLCAVVTSEFFKSVMGKVLVKVASVELITMVIVVTTMLLIT